MAEIKHPWREVLPKCEGCALFNYCKEQTGIVTTKNGEIQTGRRGNPECTQWFSAEGSLKLDYTQPVKLANNK